MKRSVLIRLSSILIAGALLLSAGGCNELLVRTNLGSLFTGWMIGAINAAGAVENQCYLNGEPIDCADLPENMQP